MTQQTTPITSVAKPSHAKFVAAVDKLLEAAQDVEDQYHVHFARPEIAELLTVLEGRMQSDACLYVRSFANDYREAVETVGITKGISLLKQYVLHTLIYVVFDALCSGATGYYQFRDELLLVLMNRSK